MKKLLTSLSDWLLWLVVGILVVGLALTFGSIQRNAESAASGTSSAIRTPTRAPYPPPDDIPKPPLRTPGGPRPFPTPPTPASTTARITREQAIAQALSHNPNYATLQARGQLTVTANLTTWGEYSKEPYPRYHPTLPVWVVKIETMPWKQWVGPVGQQMQVTYRGWGYVIDGNTGDVLVPGFRIPDDGEKK